jgi:NADH-quinone oxidoreductase subunit N
MLWVLAAVTMTVGNLAALRQKSIKRLLAYSSVAHAGYATIGLVAGPTGGWEATIFYLFVYSLMTVASFGVVALVSAGSDRQYDRDSIESLRGIGWSRPFLGLVMAAAVFSLAGMPPFAGFFGKLSLFTAAVKGGFTGLAIIAAINSVISLYYYLSILVVMYFAEAPEGERVTVPGGKHFAAQLAVFVATLGTLFTGLFAEGLFNGARAAAESISARNHSLPGMPVAKLEGGEQKKSCH